VHRLHSALREEQPAKFMQGSQRDAADALVLGEMSPGTVDGERNYRELTKRHESSLGIRGYLADLRSRRFG